MSSSWTEDDLRRYRERQATWHGIVPPNAIDHPAPVPKPAKYRNRKTADGFDSEKERRVWQELELRAKAGEITKPLRQLSYALVVNGVHICDYRADFAYMEGARQVVVDVKSEVTRKLPVYRLKKKLMQACHGIEIQEI